MCSDNAKEVLVGSAIAGAAVGGPFAALSETYVERVEDVRREVEEYRKSIALTQLRIERLKLINELNALRKELADWQKLSEARDRAIDHELKSRGIFPPVFNSRP